MIDLKKAKINTLKREGIVTNEELVTWAGGTEDDWRDQLHGHKANIIVTKLNQVLKDENKQLASEGVGSKLWRVVTVAEGHRRAAEYNLRRVDGPYITAYNDFLAVVEDIRVPQLTRDNAEAWIELMDEPRSEKGLQIMREFATELLEQTSKKVPLTAVK
jgi:hypothetical protein